MTARQFPPRGSGAQNVLEAQPSQAWVHPDQLGPHWDWKPGRVLLGKWKGRLIGRDDDRHVVTLAGNRAGKTQTALIPNLLKYPGSTVNLDPKGELAKATAAVRTKMQVIGVFFMKECPPESHWAAAEAIRWNAVIDGDARRCGLARGSRASG